MVNLKPSNEDGKKITFICGILLNGEKNSYKCDEAKYFTKNH